MEETRRKELRKILSDTTGIPENRVYFNPPSKDKLIYPCIIYERDIGNSKFADNKPYAFRIRYAITLINKDHTADIIEKIAELPMCTYDRPYKADGLFHDVFTMWY